MERTGLHADPARLADQSAELGAEIEGMVDAIQAQAGEKFNLDSPQQLSHVLFDVLGLPTQGLKKTRKGFYSTNAKVLGDLAKKHKIVADVLEYRERAKIKSTYLDALPKLIRTDGRIHTTLNQTVAATGRLSSSDPNLQNIPTRSELGHRVRTAFTVPEGSVFLACDYSQIELRLLAHLSEDEHLIAAFREGADFHAATAARVFGVPVEEVTPALRSRAKAVNFGIVYGQQAFGLASSLKIPRAEAQEMIDRYFEAYPGVRAYLDGSIEFARKTGYATTMYGRKRHIKDINSRNFQLRSFAERTAMNHPMQGTAADIIKFAMIRVPERMREEGLASKLVLQIHDELDFEVPEGEVEALSSLVRETMEGVCELRVPLLADVSYGSNWAEAK
jgi:DNA polymerase-1